MQHRKNLIIQKLGLIPVSCGGYFKETFRSPETVQIPGRQANERNVFSTTYYIMTLNRKETAELKNDCACQ